MAPRPRVRAYLRVSTKRQAEQGESLTAQSEKVRKVCDLEGWDLLDVVPEAKSGDRGRPKLAAMFEDLTGIDKFLIAKVDRFGRDFAHSVELKDRLDKAGVDLVCLDPRMDFGTAIGQVVWANLTAIAALERENIGERVAATSKLHRAAGKAAGGPRPYGYKRREGGGLVVVREEAVIVLRMYREYSAGRSVVAIQRGLEADGVRTGTGAHWSGKSIDRILQNPLYRGALAHFGEIVCEQGEHEPIIEADLWHRANDLRAAKKATRSSGRGRRPKCNHLFTGGILLCGSCGRPMRPRTYPGTGRGVYYCSGRVDLGAEFCQQEPVDQATIDGAAWRYFSATVLDQEATRREFEAVASLRVSEARVLHQQAQREVARLRSEAQRVEDDYRRGALGAETFERLSSEIAAELEGAEAEDARLGDQLTEVEASAEIGDVEAGLLRWLGDVRAAVAGEVEDADTVDSLRAALLRVFETFVLRSERDLFHIRGSEMALPGGYVIEPHLRPVWVEDRPEGRIEVFPGVVQTGLDVPKTKARTTT